ncbi:MAG: hypothetical protein LBS69_05185 [Prevotellaceae bacterium]|jgi:hypothetical protein|nr:hypothetical protein [Prevotellaceae bacterium]
MLRNIKKNSFLILIIILCFAVVGCPYDKYEGYVVYDYINTSTDDIIIITKIETGEDNIICPDTTLPEIYGLGAFYCTLSNKKNVQMISIQSHNCDTIRIFILSKDTVDRYAWEQIRQNYNIIRRYDMHINNDDLKKLGYYIYYPPSEKMKNVKMYPPYGQ